MLLGLPQPLGTQQMVVTEVRREIKVVAASGTWQHPRGVSSVL